MDTVVGPLSRTILGFSRPTTTASVKPKEQLSRRGQEIRQVQALVASPETSRETGAERGRSYPLPDRSGRQDVEARVGAGRAVPSGSPRARRTTVREPPAPRTGTTGTTETGSCVDLTSEGATFTITISDFAFDPNCFTASASQGISIVNQDAADHTFTITGTDVDVPIATGQTFNGEPISGAVTQGTYDFLCPLHPTMTG
jgi:plastocyanin